jgi:CHASE3 domain sensor protein
MTVSRQLTIMTIVMMTLFIIVGASSFASVYSLIKVNESVTHTRTVVEQLYTLQYELASCASTERGYVLTGNDDLLPSYKASADEARRIMKSLRELMADNADQKLRFERLASSVDSRLTEFDSVINVYHKEGQKAAADIVSKRGQKRLDEMQAKTAELISEEQDLFKERAEDVTRGNEGSLLTILFGVLLEIAIVFFYNITTAQTIHRCIGLLVKAMDNFDRGRFDTAPTINSQDEFGMLSRSLNQIGRTMQALQDDLHAERQKTKQALLASTTVHMQIDEARTVTSAIQNLAHKIVADNEQSSGQAVTQRTVSLVEEVRKASTDMSEIYEKQVSAGSEAEQSVSAARPSLETTNRKAEKVNEKVTSMSSAIADLQGHITSMARLDDQLLWLHSSQADKNEPTEAQTKHARTIIEECRQHNTEVEKLLARILNGASALESLGEEIKSESASALKDVQAARQRLSELQAMQSSGELVKKSLIDTAYETVQMADRHLTSLMTATDRGTEHARIAKELEDNSQVLHHLLRSALPSVDPALARETNGSGESHVPSTVHTQA